jgi:hypothetical protein
LSPAELKKVIDQLIAYIRKTHGLIIAELTAEEAIRRSFSEGGVIELKGRDAQTGLPRTLWIRYGEIWQRSGTRPFARNPAGCPMSYVRIKKLRSATRPVAPPGDPSMHQAGQFQNIVGSLPVGYTVEGWLVSPPAVGGRVVLIRLVRNGLRRPGVFWSTCVTKVVRGCFQTLNSVYRIEEVAPFSKN